MITPWNERSFRCLAIPTAGEFLPVRCCSKLFLLWNMIYTFRELFRSHIKLFAIARSLHTTSAMQNAAKNQPGPKVAVVSRSCPARCRSKVNVK